MESSEGDGGRSSPIADLPCTVMIDILARLPLDDHVSCRLVCKQWNGLVSEPYFHRLYLARTPTLILLPRGGISIGGVARNLDFVEHHAASGTTKRELRFDQGSGRYHLRIGNFCNGFVSLFNGGQYVRIWNPVEERSPIQDRKWFALGQSFKIHDGKILWGLGLSHRNEYKLIWIQRRIGTERLEAGIHIFGSKLVRDVGEVPYLLNFDFMGVYLNRAIHWIFSDQEPELICRFDLDTEEFGLLPPPPDFYRRINLKRLYQWSNVGVLEDCLYICASDTDVFHPPIEVWMMKVYGQQDSWVRMYEIKNPAIEWWSPKRYFQLIKVTPEGKIIMACGGHDLLSYDQRTRKIQVLLQSSFEAIPFVPTSLPQNTMLSRGKTTTLLRAQVTDQEANELLKKKGRKEEALVENKESSS